MLVQLTSRWSRSDRAWALFSSNCFLAARKVLHTHNPSTSSCTQDNDHAGDQKFRGCWPSHLEQFTSRSANRNAFPSDVRSTSEGPPVWLIGSASEDYLWRAPQIHSSSSSSSPSLNLHLSTSLLTVAADWRWVPDQQLYSRINLLTQCTLLLRSAMSSVPFHRWTWVSRFPSVFFCQLLWNRTVGISSTVIYGSDELPVTQPTVSQRWMKWPQPVAWPRPFSIHCSATCKAQKQWELNTLHDSHG